MEKYIVAEITKNWEIGTPVEDLISQRFEKVININAGRGYMLHDWKFYVTNKMDVMTETIIAVFVKI